MHHFFLICLAVVVVGACEAQPAHTQSPQASPTGVLSSTATRAPVPVTETIAPAPTSTSLPTVDLSIAATQIWAPVDPSAILWSGVIDRSVFRQVMAEEMSGQSWFSASTYDTQFQLSSRPVLIAAYFYEVTPGGERHGRFLMYQPEGKLKSVPFLFKFDLPVVWVGEHEEYGNYDSIVDKIEWESREPMLPNFLSMAVLSELNCQGKDSPFCRQLKSSGIHLPADGPAAEALVMDQIAAAREITKREWPDLSAVMNLAEQGPAWWNDSRLPLLALPRVTTCVPDAGCATYINMELAIDMVNGGP